MNKPCFFCKGLSDSAAPINLVLLPELRLSLGERVGLFIGICCGCSMQGYDFEQVEALVEKELHFEAGGLLQ